MASEEEPRTRLEFRKVLVRVSDGLGQEDLRGLKNLCYDYVSERRREEMDTGIVLFNVLIERGRACPQVLCVDQ
jgi:predicted secreted protein